MKLLKFDETPEWRRNLFITTGYRPETPSFVQCLKTWLFVHNEIANIMTHFFGAIMLLIVISHKLSCDSDNFRPADRYIFAGLFFSCIFCFLMSALFHTFGCHSKAVFKIFAKLDYFGISVVMMTGGSVVFYYGFYDSEFYQSLYIWLFCIYCSLSLFITHTDRFSDPECHLLRAIIFLLEGFLALVPFVHLFLKSLNMKQSAGQKILKGMQLLLLAAIFNLIGAIIYMYKFPERLKPGFFDIAFSSHQVFHVHHIAAAIIYYHAIAIMAGVHIDQSYAINKNNVYLKLNDTKS